MDTQDENLATIVDSYEPTVRRGALGRMYGSIARYARNVVGSLALVSALGGAGCDCNGREEPVTPIDAPDPRPGEDPVTGEPRMLDPESPDGFYLETNMIRNEESHAYGEVILLQTAGGPDQIYSINDLPGVALVSYTAFSDYLFGPAGPSAPMDAETCPGSDKNLLTLLQELYRRIGIEALNQPDNDAGAIEAALQLEATLEALYLNDTGRGIQLDPANPVVAGYSTNGTPFIGGPSARRRRERDLDARVRRLPALADPCCGSDVWDLFPARPGQDGRGRRLHDRQGQHGILSDQR